MPCCSGMKGLQQDMIVEIKVHFDPHTFMLICSTKGSLSIFSFKVVNVRFSCSVDYLYVGFLVLYSVSVLVQRVLNNCQIDVTDHFDSRSSVKESSLRSSFTLKFFAWLNLVVWTSCNRTYLWDQRGPRVESKVALHKIWNKIHWNVCEFYTREHPFRSIQRQGTQSYRYEILFTF